MKISKLGIKIKDKKLRIGVFGLRRGAGFLNLFDKNPYTKVVAACDFDELRTMQLQKWRQDIVVYNDYGKFLEHDLDIVVICSYATEHAPQAVKALEAGKHVLSEVIACKTMAEGVALCRAVEKSKKLYMFAENYCYFSYTQEMQNLYRKGIIGPYRYGECEYIHDCRAEWPIVTNGPSHWRTWLPSTYYCTHSLGPIITITGTRPVKVTGFVVPNKLGYEAGRCGDDWGLLICTMDNDALTKVIPWSNGAHSGTTNWYRLYGTKGLMENNRWREYQRVNLFVQTSRDKHYQKSYMSKFRTHAAEATKEGHNGSDFFVIWRFIQAIVKGEKSPIDVYQAMDMTLPGILGYRSALQGNVPLAVPDFRNENVRKKYENDDWSPDPKDKRPGQPPPSILGDIKIPERIYEKIEKERKKRRNSEENNPYLSFVKKR